MYVLVVGLMAVMRVWNHRGPARWQPVTGPLGAIALLGLGAAAGVDVGLGGGTAGIRYAAAAVVAVGVAYLGALVVPVARRALRSAPIARPAWRTALVDVPLATVAFEEAAFRGVLWGLIDRGHGALWATGVTALLFGLWHAGRGQWGAVLFTAAAGVVFGLLRDAGGNLLAPVALHWAANGFGVLAAAWAAGMPEPADKPDVT